MFGHLIYFNKERVTEYNAILNGNPIIEYDSVSTTKENTGEANLKIMKGEHKSVENYHGKVIANDMLICNEFINNLKSKDDYLDFLDSEITYDGNYLTRGNIIRFESNLIVPESFDLFQTWDSYKEYFHKEFTSEVDKKDLDAFNTFFKTKELKIPVLLDLNNKLCCALLVSSLLKCEYEIVEELENDDIVILAKVVSPNKRKEKEIFNPLSDFLSFNRYIRRYANIADDLPTELNKIYVDSDYVSLEILAIYQ